MFHFATFKVLALNVSTGLKHTLDHSFSNCGTCNITGITTIVYWLIFLNMKHKVHTFANTQQCWQYYVIDLKFYHFYLNKKNIGGTLKLLM